MLYLFSPHNFFCNIDMIKLMFSRILYVKINVITTYNGSKYKTLQSELNSLITEFCKTEYDG